MDGFPQSNEKVDVIGNAADGFRHTFEVSDDAA
jgi:hypothetical protein